MSGLYGTEFGVVAWTPIVIVSIVPPAPGAEVVDPAEEVHLHPALLQHLKERRRRHVARAGAHLQGRRAAIADEPLLRQDRRPGFDVAALRVVPAGIGEDEVVTWRRPPRN